MRSPSSSTPPLQRAKQTIALYIQFLRNKSFRQEVCTYQRILLQISACMSEQRTGVVCRKERGRELSASSCYTSLWHVLPIQQHITGSARVSPPQNYETGGRPTYALPIQRTKQAGALHIQFLHDKSSRQENTLTDIPFTASRLQGQGRAHHCVGRTYRKNRSLELTAGQRCTHLQRYDLLQRNTTSAARNNYSRHPQSYTVGVSQPCR